MKLFRAATAALVLGGMVLGVGMPAMADWGDRGPRKGGEWCRSGQYRVVDPEVMSGLNLNQEQKAAMWDLFQDRKRNRDEDGKVRELMQKVRSGQDIGVGLKTEARDEIIDRIMGRQESVTKLYSILTEEQREKFEAATKERVQERTEWFGKGQVRDKEQSRGRRGEHPFMGRMADELNLTDGQQAQIRDILESEREQRREHREEAREMHVEHREMFRMAWTANPDREEMRKFAEKAANDRVERMLQSGEMIKKIRSVLTEEQLEKLDDCMDNWPGRVNFGPRGHKGKR